MNPLVGTEAPQYPKYPYPEFAIAPSPAKYALSIGNLSLGGKESYSVAEVRLALDSPSDQAEGRGLGALPQTEIIAEFESPLPPSRKVYVGPIYLQGFEPTCMAWAITHSMLAIGQTPTPEITRALINTSLSNRGLNMFAAGGVINEAGGAVKYDLPHLANHAGKHSPSVLAAFIKSELDGGSAMLAAINLRTEATEKGKATKGHAVSIVGYEVASDGHMNLQIIDPAYGEGVLAIETLAAELDKHHAMSPSMAVISPFKADNT